MENTPPPSVSGDVQESMSVRTFGGKLADVAPATMTKFNIHDHPAVAAVARAFVKMEVLSLSAFVVPTLKQAENNLHINVGWGHCEHATPRDLAEMAQLPAFASQMYAGGGRIFGNEEGLVCPFNEAVTRHLKPVALEGGRPSLFVWAAGVTSAGADISKPLVQVFFRISVKVSGADIVFN